MSDTSDRLTIRLADRYSTDRHVGVSGRARAFLRDSGIKRCVPLLTIGSLLLPLGCGDDTSGPDYATLVLTTTSLPNAKATVAYSETLVATGGDSTYTWSVTVGSLPTGLSLTASTGLISGTPSVEGSQTFTVQVASGDGQTDTQQLTITVEPLPVTLSGVGTATIDGIMRAGEWERAAQTPVFAGSLAGSMFYVMNDESNLYVALSVVDPTLSTDDMMSLRFDNAHNGVTDDGDDRLNAGVSHFRDGHFNGAGAGWGTLDLQHDGNSAATSTGATNVYEVSHPLNSGDAQDFSLSIGDVVGVCLTYFLDGTAYSWSTFPIDCRLAKHAQQKYADIVIAPPEE